MIPAVAVMIFLTFRWVSRTLRISINWKRLEQLIVSPLLSNITEFITGVRTIRSYNKIGYLEQQFFDNVDKFTTVELCQKMT